MREYNLFISHSWNYTDAYVKLCSLLDKAEYFSYKNYSVPKDDPFKIKAQTVRSYENILRENITEQMKYASVVLILAGVYSSYSDAINMEIEIAKELCKPIIAIEPFASERTSQVVKDSADEVVPWRTSSIVDAIKKHSL